ncbi:MAG: hypothetical protein EXQ69_04275 [Acidimicrobiia bacterium]|nr:hypothetical protein [Acidimicrobiia bacterium]
MNIEIRFTRNTVGDGRRCPVSFHLSVDSRDEAELLVAGIADAFDEFAPGSMTVELASLHE